jgi:hypothetical protein
VVLLIMLMVFLPLVAWIYRDSQNNVAESQKLNADTRKIQIKVEKALKKLEDNK